MREEILSDMMRVSNCRIPFMFSCPVVGGIEILLSLHVGQPQIYIHAQV